MNSVDGGKKAGREVPADGFRRREVRSLVGTEMSSRRGGRTGKLEGMRGQGFLGGPQHGPKQVVRGGNRCSEARREGREKTSFVF